MQILIDTLSLPMQSPTGLNGLVRAGVSCQRQHLQRFIVERDGRIHCVCCEEDRVPHSGWSSYHQDNVYSHFQQHHPDVEVYPAQDYVAAAAAFKRQRELATQPPITLKFHKVESKAGVDQALRILEKHPGLPLHLASNLHRTCLHKLIASATQKIASLKFPTPYLPIYPEEQAARKSSAGRLCETGSSCQITGSLFSASFLPCTLCFWF